MGENTAEMNELDAWGAVSIIVVPSGIHCLDAAAWKAGGPHAKVEAKAALERAATYP